MSSRSKPEVGLLVLDLDNTLWDWVDVWVNSFSALLDELAKATGIPLATLKAEARAVHRLRGTTEYSLLVDELPSLQPFLKGQPARVHFDAALHAQNSVRKHQTKLYPGVLPTLLNLRSRGVKIVAYTESIAYWTEWRIRETSLDGVIDVLYSSLDHDFPAAITPEQLRRYPKDAYGLTRTKHLHVARGIDKPDSRILEEIVSKHGVGSRGIAYVGDSLAKDIVMARKVGVYDVHAAYGEAHKRPEYSLLREVSHWDDDTIERERATARGALPKPTYVLKNRFAELLDLFDFGPVPDVSTHVALWSKAVDVQQHFNDIGWRIRALALTATTFVLGGTGFAYANAGTISHSGVSIAILVPAIGALFLLAFWFMDALYFHRLLGGAVKEALRLERLLNDLGVRVGLGGEIREASPLGPLRSTQKLHLFYGVLGAVLLAAVATLIGVGPPTPIPTDVSTPVPTDVSTPVPTDVSTPVPTDVSTPVPTDVDPSAVSGSPSARPTVHW